MTSLNAYMHPRNIYKNPLNFEELCGQYPELLTYISRKPNGKMLFNFKDRNGLRCLCTVLLKKDFGLEVIIPENRLVPTLPLRLNYILWIEDLLQHHAKNRIADCVNGLDIGTGATCIYPLLIAKKNGWKMTGVDLDADVIDTARTNVRINNLTHLITITEISSSLSELFSGDIHYDFCMCNPPFFDSTQHEFALPQKQNRAARLQARKQTSGMPNEISSPGGEIAFIRNIIEESAKLGDRVRIYSTMIGCKSSMQPVLDILKEKEINVYCETKFCQGRTMRWAIAWTFTDTSLESSIPLFPKKKPSKSLTWTLKPKYNFKKCVNKMDLMLKELEVDTETIKRSKNVATWKIQAHRNTWTGLRRKRREEQLKVKIDNHDPNNMVNSEMEQNSSSVMTSIETKIDSEDISDREDSVPCKKMRLNEEPESTILEAEIELKQLRQNTNYDISIQITYIKGQKETPQQILQYFKNNLI